MRDLLRRRTEPREPSTEPGDQAGDRRLMWFLLAAALILLPFLSLPGRYVSDTRDSLWLDPSGYLGRTFVLWRSSPFLGHEQHDGIALPMGVIAWLLRGAGLPAWAAERVWHGLLLLVGAGGTILLVDHLRGRRSVAAPLTAGLAYVLTPYTFGYGLPTSGPYLAYALLPVLLLIALRGALSGGLAWPALFALAAFLMGGGNGAPQIYALITVGLLLLWLLAVDRQAGPQRVLTFAGLAAVLTVGVNAYWLFLLGSSEVSNALTFSEQPGIINVSSSASETVRGLGFWMFYGGDRFGSWVPTVRSYATNPLYVLAGFAVPIAALVSAWLVRWRFRLFFLFLSILAVFVIGGIFPVDSPTPFGRTLLTAYREVPGAAGLRTTYKFAASLSLALAVLVGIGVGAAWERIARLPRTPRLRWRTGLVAVVVLVVGLNAHPLLTGKAYNADRANEGLPGYWEEALARLEERGAGYRAFFAPASERTVYRWGALREGIAWATPSLASVHPVRLPIGHRYGSNLVLALEQSYLADGSAAGSAQLFRALGVRDVVLQNDIDADRSATASAQEMQVLKEDPALLPLTSFGTPVDPGGTDGGSALPPVEVLTVRDPQPIVHLARSTPIVVSGDGFGVAAAARAGLLERGRPVLYSGDLDAAELTALLREGRVSFVITDSNRRRLWNFTTPRATGSYTLPAGPVPDITGASFGLFDDRIATQTVAIYPGLRSITASGYGGTLRAEPTFRPSNAFDGDPATAWLTGALGDPVGEWIQATFPRPRRLSEVTLVTPNLGIGRQLQTVRLEFSDGTSVIADVAAGEPVTVGFPERRSRFLRIRAISVTPGLGEVQNGVGLAEIEIPGIEAQEVIALPRDLLATAARTEPGLDGLATAPIAFVFERLHTRDPADQDVEVRMLRRFEVPALDVYTVSGTVQLDGTAPDDEIDLALLGRTPVRISSSGRLFGNPALRGSAAFDGDQGTAWVTKAVEGATLRVEFGRRRIDGIEIDTQLGEGRTPIVRVRATFSDGSSEVGVLASLLDGTIAMEFDERLTESVELTIEQVGSLLDNPPPIGIVEVRIPGLEVPTARPADRLPCLDRGYRLDGSPISVRAQGTVRDLLEGRELQLTLCRGSGLVLQQGEHELVADGPLRPNALILSSTPAGAGEEEEEVEALELPDVRVSTVRGGGYDVRIAGATDPFYLVIGQNWSPGWTATIEGRTLGTPLVVDGYSAGWRLHRQGSYLVRVRYAPQGRYAAAVVVSVLSLALVLGLLVMATAQRRRHR